MEYDIKSYDEWQEEGYQVMSGEQAADFDGTVALFDSDQVCRKPGWWKDLGYDSAEEAIEDGY